MKKRVIAIICAVIAVIAIAVFVKSAKNDVPDTTTTSAEAEPEETTEDNSPEFQNGTKNPNKLIKITMPLSHFDAQKQSDIGGFFQKGSYENCKINQKKKTFTITIKSLTHDFMLSNVGLQVIKNLTAIFDSEDFPYVKGLGKYNSNFSEIELLVDADAYSADNNKEGLTTYVASCGIFYQLYTTENEYQCKVIIKNEKGEKVIDEVTLRQDNSGLIS